MEWAFLLANMSTVTLVMMRVTGILLVAPPFSAGIAPPQVRAMLALLLTVLIAPTVGVWADAGPVAFWAAAVSELLLGISIGFICLLLILAIQGAGDMIDYEMGFGMVQMIDPQYGQPVPLAGNFLYLFALMLFFAADAHLTVLRALLTSFEWIPLGGAAWRGSIFTGIVAQFAWVITVAVQLCLPIVAVLFLATVMMAIMARAMPQFNVFLIGLPLKIGIGFFAMAVALPVIARFFIGTLDEVFARVTALLSVLGAGS